MGGAPPVCREDSALPTCLPGLPLALGWGSWGVPAGCVLCPPVMPTRVVHRGQRASCREQGLPLSHEGTFHRLGSVWGAGRAWWGGSESLSLQSRLGPAAPSGLGGAQAGWGAEEQGAGSLHSVWSTCGWRLRPAPLFPHSGEGVSQGPPPLPPAACPRGRFGAGCAHVCRCGPGATCDPVTGTCTCPPGRTGAHCELGECPRPHSHGRSRGPGAFTPVASVDPASCPGPEGQWAAQHHPRPSLA